MARGLSFKHLLIAGALALQTAATLAQSAPADRPWLDAALLAGAKAEGQVTI